MSNGICWVCRKPSELYTCQECKPPERQRAGRLVKVQETNVIEVDKDYSAGDQSPYWEWVHTHKKGWYKDGKVDSDEPHVGNPDHLSMDDKQPWIKESGLSVGDLSKLLTKRQRQIFELTVQEGKNPTEISAILGVKRSVVYTHLKRIQEKVRSRL